MEAERLRSQIERWKSTAEIEKSKSEALRAELKALRKAAKEQGKATASVGTVGTQHDAKPPPCEECEALSKVRLELLGENEAQARRHEKALREAEEGIGALSELRGRVSQLEADLERARAEISSQRGRAAALESERDGLLTLKREKERLAVRVTDLEGDLVSAIGEKSALGVRLADLERQLDEKQMHSSDENGEDESFPAVLERELLVMRSAYEDKIRVLKDGFERKEWELQETLRAINDTARSERAILKGRITALESQINRDRAAG